MILVNLFEYKNKASFPGGFNNLEEFLDEIWKNREKHNFYEKDKERPTGTQQFLQFLHKTKEIKSNNYVGVIQFEGQRVNLLPKIFYRFDKELKEDGLQASQNHIL